MTNRFKEKLTDLRELIWPLLEPLPDNRADQVNEENCHFNDNEIDFILSYIEKYELNEESRRKDIESKSTIFIGTFTVIVTILTSIIKNMTEQTEGLLNVLSIFVMILAIIYLSRAIWFSIKVLQRHRYFKFGFPKFMFEDNKDKKKRIVVEKYNNIKRNQDEINIMVDNMTMAQEYFKRAIITVVAFSIILLLDVVTTRYGWIAQSIFRFCASNRIVTYYIADYIVDCLMLFIFYKIISKLIK